MRGSIFQSRPQIPLQQADRYPVSRPDSKFEDQKALVAQAYQSTADHLYEGEHVASRPAYLLDRLSEAPDKFDGTEVMSYADAAARFLVVMGKPFNLKDRPFLIPIMNCDAPEIVLQCGRQVGKTIFIASDQIIHGVTIPNYPLLYVTPRGNQASVFSRDVFHAICRSSPEIQPYISGDATWQVNVREFTTGSRTYFRSAYHSPDGIRGLTAGGIYYDERQDLVSDFVPIISECAANFPDRRVISSGTPKSKSNHLSKEYYRSSCCEWLVKCQKCNHWNFQDIDIIGKEGYICKKCSKPLRIQEGKWVAGNPSQLGKHNGFRITQMMNPNVSFEDVKAKIDKMTSTELTINNEIFGLPFDEGALVLSEEDIAAACGGHKMAPRSGKRFPFDLYAGVDWGGGNIESSQASFSVIVIGGFRGERFCPVFIHRFERHEADIYRQPEYISQILRAFKVSRTICDYGFGTINNRRLVNDFGFSPFRLMEAQATNVREYVKWSKAGRWMYNRTEACIKIIDSIKQKRIRFPRWEDMKTFVSDFTGIFVEENSAGVISFDHNTPDDVFMALFYCYLSATLDTKGVSRFAIENWASGINSPMDTPEYPR